MGNDAIKSEPSPDSIDRLIKKRIRAERGVPAVVAAFPGGPSSVDHLQGSVIGYCNGVCAWIEKSTDRTSIFLIHLSSGKISKLTTENRESLNQIKVSDTLVSAISVRGYVSEQNPHGFQSERHLI